MEQNTVTQDDLTPTISVDLALERKYRLVANCIDTFGFGVTDGWGFRHPVDDYRWTETVGVVKLRREKFLFFFTRERAAIIGKVSLSQQGTWLSVSIFGQENVDDMRRVAMLVKNWLITVQLKSFELTAETAVQQRSVDGWGFPVRI